VEHSTQISGELRISFRTKF